MSKCQVCGYDDNGTGDNAHVCRKPNSNIDYLVRGLEFENENLTKELDSAMFLLQNHNELKSLVKSFFDDYLDVVEVSDGGNEFHPIKISCARAMKLQPLSDLLKRMKELSNEHTN